MVFNIILLIIIYGLFRTRINRWIINNVSIFITSIMMLVLSLILRYLFYNFLYSLIMPIVVIFILLIINAIFPRIFAFYKKNDEDKNYIIRLIINYLVIYSIIYLMDSFLISIIYSFVLIYFIILNKLYPRHNLFKSILISSSPIIIIIVLVISIGRINTILEWNKIKDDYKIINNRVLEYKEEICKIDACNNIDSVIYLTNPSEKINFTNEELKAIERIRNYYSTQEEINIYSDRIVYGSFEYIEVEIIYFIDKKQDDYDYDYDNITKLENNWYKVDYGW